MEKILIIVRINEAKALSDEVRAFILDLLTEKPMSVHEIAEELKKKGMYKNINTIRYHIQVLKEAGLIDLVATKEIKGGVLKHYAARKKVYLFEVPEDIAKILAPITEKYYDKLKKLILDILRDNREIVIEAARKLKPCPYCITKHFAEYVVLESLRITLGKVIHDPEVKSELEKFKVEEEEPR